MPVEDYVEILKFVLHTQIDGVHEDADLYGNSEFLDGVERGLEIALEKIEASKFIYENR